MMLFWTSMPEACPTEMSLAVCSTILSGRDPESQKLSGRRFHGGLQSRRKRPKGAPHSSYRIRSFEQTSSVLTKLTDSLVLSCQKKSLRVGSWFLLVV